MKTLPEMFERVARENAERIAVVDGETEISYGALEKRIATLAATLSCLGILRGDRVALLLPNSLGFVTSYFAIVTVGGIVVPLNDHYQETEIISFLEVCGVSLLITSRHFSPLCHRVLSMGKSPCKLFFIEDEQGISEQGLTALSDVKAQINPHAPVMFQFSSGSTGKPKRIARTHSHLLFELDSFNHTLDLTTEDRFLGVAPFSHVNGLMRSMMASIRAGATLYPLSRFDRQAVFEVIEKKRISIFIAVPFMFSILAQTSLHRQPDFSSLRYCISASAPMPKRFSQQFYEKFGIYVRQLYGSTETGTISVNLSSDIEKSLESVGTPIRGVAVEVFTEDGQLAKEGEMGEIVVKSPGAIEAYDGLGEENREAFRRGYFFAGDLGRRDSKGLLYLIGRKKFIINKGGYKIDPHDLEELLENHPSVAEAVVLGVPTAYGDEKVKAVIVLKEPCTVEEIVEYCRGKIADFKIPSLVEFRNSLPRSSTGKILRKMLMEE